MTPQMFPIKHMIIPSQNERVVNLTKLNHKKRVLESINCQQLLQD